jgi:ATP-binding cassette, subfamily B, bacterial
MRKKEIIFEVISFLKKYQARLYIAFASLVTVVSCVMTIGIKIRKFIDSDVHFKTDSLSGILILIVIFGCASFLRSYIINSTAEYAANDVKKKAFETLLELKTSKIDEFTYSDLQTRVNSDSESISKIIIDLTSFYIRNALSTVGGIIFMFFTSIKLSLIAFFVIGSITFLSSRISKTVRKLARDAEDAKQKASNLVFESIINNKVISSFGVENLIKQHFYKVNTETIEKIDLRLRFRSIFFAGVITSMLVTIISIIWLGTLEVEKGMMTQGLLASFLFYSFIAATSFGGIIEMMSDLEKNLANCERVFDIINLNEQSQEDQNVSLDLSSDIVMENISYSYDAENLRKTIDNINITFPNGKFSVITGKSGIGKTTILNLIMGLYKPISGNIIVAGKKFSNLAPKMWKHNLSYVPQDNLLFSGTILENITFFADNPDIGKVNKILKGLVMDEFVESLPNKLNTNIGSLASKISGGQKQRIAIARALYASPKILILDEATSQLDENTETKVLEFIKSFSKDITIICVAHRKGAISMSDNLVSIK